MSNIAGVLGGALNPNEHDTTDNNSPVPPGEYALLIEKAELRDSQKNSANKYVWVQTTITGPSYAGRKVFNNFNIVNSNPEAERIGRADLAKLAIAVGLPAVQDTSELVGKAFVASLKVKDGDNEIKGYKPISGGAPQQQAPAQHAQQAAPATAQAAAPAKKKMPWEK